MRSHRLSQFTEVPLRRGFFLDGQLSCRPLETSFPLRLFACNISARIVIDNNHMSRVTIAFDGNDIEQVEQACRELAERAHRDAESAKGRPLEQIHQGMQSRFLRLAERLKVARRLPDPHPLAFNSSWPLIRH
jgi:hypothetical protein